MGKSSWERKLEDLNRQLAREKLAHAKTRQRLDRWRWLATPRILDLMGVYPPLRKLLHVLAEAADLQDPSRGAPIEDTMRVGYIPDGENASTSSTELAVLTHRKHRADVRFIGRELDILRREFTNKLEAKTAEFAAVSSASQYEYELPIPPVCHRKDCRKRGVRQSYTAYRLGCEGCGRRFEKEVANG
jgi:hypothetical protein